MTKSLRITGKNSDGEYWLHIEGATQSAGLNLGDPPGMICSALLMAASGHTYIRKDAPELVALVEAHRQLIREFGGTTNGHRACVIANAALAQWEALQ